MSILRIRTLNLHNSSLITTSFLGKKLDGGGCDESKAFS
jgi:hypothetical protein